MSPFMQTNTVAAFATVGMALYAPCPQAIEQAEDTCAVLSEAAEGFYAYAITLDRFYRHAASGAMGAVEPKERELVEQLSAELAQAKDYLRFLERQQRDTRSRALLGAHRDKLVDYYQNTIDNLHDVGDMLAKLRQFLIGELDGTQRLYLTHKDIAKMRDASERQYKAFKESGDLPDFL